MSLYFNPLTFSGTITNRPGPKTPQGRAVAARNATTHGLFARDVVLPALGEDPAAYETLAAARESQFAPNNLLERHYAEQIAAASWRLRRLHRWQAQVYEDESLTEDERLDRLDKVLRHETALHRQIDRAVRMLARDVPQLFQARARGKALADYDATERDCRDEPDLEVAVCRRTREYLRGETLPPGLDLSALDNTRPAPEAPGPEETTPAAAENCQNEPVANEDSLGGSAPPPASAPPHAPGIAKTNPAGDPPTAPAAHAGAQHAAFLRADVLNSLSGATAINRGLPLELPAR